MRKIYFLFGIHNHQPVGNFPEVIEKGYKDCYWPFIEAISRHPKIKWSLHCTGILWDYFMEKHPEYIDAVRKMSDSGQAEMVAGGYYEPIMPPIPDRDKIGQIRKHREFIKKTFNKDASGMWLAERVWEPYLCKPLAEAGIDYTVVDDAHFAAAGLDPEKLRGYYVSEEQGTKLNIFPISQLLRYSIPFHTVEKNLEYFRSFAQESGNPAVAMFDDGEKFGMWPETNKHCYQDRWLENFLDMLDRNSDWIETITFSEYMKKFGPSGRVYLPTASYFEMSEWALPADSQEEFEKIEKRFKNEPAVTRWLRGGFWRNFLSKYEESNNMHKKMLYISGQVDDLKKNRPDDAASVDSLNALYQGQCNCTYWHGVFGGLYLPHLRNGVYSNLIKAEKYLRQAVPPAKKWLELDLDCDGKNEIIYEDMEQNIYAAPSKGGSIFEWDILPLELNMQNVLTRRKEAYHAKLREFLSKPQDQGDNVKSIHDIVQVKEKNLDNYLNYDWYRRTSLLDHFLHPLTKFDDFKRCQYGEQGDFVLGEYARRVEGKTLVLTREGTVWNNDKPYRIKVQKEITPYGQGYTVKYTLSNLSHEHTNLVFAPEFNIAFSNSTPGDDGIKKDVKEWSRRDEPFGFEYKLSLTGPCDLWVFPLETVSLSEFGFERTYQGTVALCSHSIDLAPAEPVTIEINVEIKKPSQHKKKK